jgi:septal ring factor EnvC (AmiA/AmiB activator)
MLESMQKKVTEEGEQERKLYDKFMCYCKNSKGDLAASISGANTKIPQVSSDIKTSEEQKVQLEEDLKQHQADRAAAKDAMASSTAIREKESAAFAKEKAEYDANIAAVKSAVKAIGRGMAGGFLQTPSAQVLRQLVASSQNMVDMDRQEVAAFLEGGAKQGAEYTPSGGEVTGILKSMSDDMEKNLAEATKDEKDAINVYEALISAKTKEVQALTKSIETKMTRVGELGVSIVQMKNDLSDTEAGLIEDQKFLAGMDKNCKTKEAEWQDIVKTRSQELVAIAETIKILNDDDALDLFKKALPGTSASFVQVKMGDAAERARALSLIVEAKRKYSTSLAQIRPNLDFIAMAIQGKKIGFEKVIKMIDEMVANLKNEQQDDDDKSEYCAKQLDFSEDKKKGLEQTVSDLETQIANNEEALATTKEDIKILEKSIKDLDKAVAEATEQRKDEHEEFTELMASDSAAKELLLLAKNRLAKFYNPKLYKAPPKVEEPEAMFAQISLHVHHKDAPAPPPETFGAYSKKSEESGGVVAMLDLLIKDLEKEITYAETTEENAQKMYEETMKESAFKRAQDSKALTDKGATQASLETDIESRKESRVGAGKDLMATEAYISSLHAECDWLMKYYDVRKEARSGEVDALKQAKAVLSGASFSFVQGGSRGLKRRTTA